MGEKKVARPIKKKKIKKKFGGTKPINKIRGKAKNNNNSKQTITYIPEHRNANTIKSTTGAVRKLKAIITNLKKIDGKKIKNVEDIFALDKFAFNTVMEIFVKGLKKNDGDIHKNTSIMTTILGIQRAVNEYKKQAWMQDHMEGLKTVFNNADEYPNELWKGLNEKSCSPLNLMNYVKIFINI